MFNKLTSFTQSNFFTGRSYRKNLPILLLFAISITLFLVSVAQRALAFTLEMDDLSTLNTTDLHTPEPDVDHLLTPQRKARRRDLVVGVLRSYNRPAPSRLEADSGPAPVDASIPGTEHPVLAEVSD